MKSGEESCTVFRHVTGVLVFVFFFRVIVFVQIKCSIKRGYYRYSKDCSSPNCILGSRFDSEALNEVVQSCK